MKSKEFKVVDSIGGIFPISKEELEDVEEQVIEEKMNVSHENLSKIKIGSRIKIIHGEYEGMEGVVSNILSCHNPDTDHYLIDINNLKGVKKFRCQITDDFDHLTEGETVEIIHGDYSGRTAEVISYNKDTKIVGIKVENGIVTYKDRDFVMQYKESNIPIMCLCGSMQLYDDMIMIAEKYTSEGWLVLLPFKTDIYENGEETCKMVHHRRIELANAIYVVIGNDHIGENTMENINYAYALGKPVKYIDITSRQ